MPALRVRRPLGRRAALLVVLIAVGALSTGCENGGGDQKAPARSGSRVNAVAAKAEEAPAPQAFCDVYKAADEAPQFAYPELDGSAPTPPQSGWRWVNVWATWCKPCIEEMPRLVEWEAEMDQVGDLVLVSVDETPELVANFREEHPATPESLRTPSPEALGPWLESLGVFDGASLPVHIFVDPEGRFRCARAGGVSETDRDAVERLLSEG